MSLKDFFPQPLTADELRALQGDPIKLIDPEPPRLEPIDFDLLDRQEHLLAELLTIHGLGGPVGVEERDEFNVMLTRALKNVRALKARRPA